MSSLTQFYDGNDYDLRHKDYNTDIPFWLQMSKMYGSPILELACGTGRITVPLCNEGHKITGIDISKSMINQAKSKIENEDRAEFLIGDVRDFNLEQMFGLIIFPFNSMSHLISTDDIERTFDCVKKHLLPEGKFIIDLFNPNLNLLNRPTDQHFPHVQYYNSAGELIEVTEKNAYDSASQVNKLKFYYTKDGELLKVESIDMRMYFPQELEAILKYNGFKVDYKYGNYQLGRFTSHSDKQLIVCSLN